MKKGFTLAEVLITLVIIGVVAALTIPTLVVNYQKKMYVTQLKKSYNNVVNGFKTYIANNGVTKLSDTQLYSIMLMSDEEIAKLGDPMEVFIGEFSRMFKFSKITMGQEITGDDLITYKTLNGEDFNDQFLSIGGFYMADGSYVVMAFDVGLRRVSCSESYSSCKSLKEFQEKRHTPTKLWEQAGYVYIDVNGKKGPNILGRDLFLFMLGNDGMLYPEGGMDFALFEFDSSCSYAEISNCQGYWKSNKDYSCTNSASSFGFGCAGRIIEEGWEMNY